MDRREVVVIFEEELLKLEKRKRGIGLTICVTAAFLAIATMFSHEAHTHEAVAQARAVDAWGYYQAKHGRAHAYGMEAELITLQLGEKGQGEALRDYEKSIEEQCGRPALKDCIDSVPRRDDALRDALVKKYGHPIPEHDIKQPPEKKGAVDIQADAQKEERQVLSTQHQALVYDVSELLLEISIVLCSVSLLAESRLYWKVSFITTGLAVLVTIFGWFMPLFHNWLKPEEKYIRWLFPH